MESDAPDEKARFAISCAIWLRGEHLEPDLITASLGITPTSTRRKGEVHHTSAGTAITARIGIWKVHVRGDGSDFQPAISALLATFAHVDKGLLTLPGVADAMFDIYGTADRGEDLDAAYLSLSPQQVQRLAALDLAIDVSLSFFAQPSHEA
ncbi:MAG TPA: DUF4279 domain-containing protein [Devosia sp.]|nr:DUF4279 domain-containing protein [Devosia sp.]